MAWASLRKLRKEVKDPVMRRKLTPEYKIGCKRILNSDDYYPSFNRPNVRLVTEGIERFNADGIVTTDGKEYALDAAVFATGFEVADLNLYIKILGLHNQNLVEEWKSTGAEAYLGTTVSGYPNLAFLLGPNTGLGHNSILHMIEFQMNYIMQYLEYLQKSGDDVFLDLKKDVQDAYNERIQKQLKKTVWSSGCKSWYMNANGKNTTLFTRGLLLPSGRKRRNLTRKPTTQAGEISWILSFATVLFGRFLLFFYLSLNQRLQCKKYGQLSFS